MSLHPISMLLVEDNPGDVLLTRKAFERCRIANELHVVSNGEQALDYLRRQGEFADAERPDLVLLDINLPRMSGLEVLETIKEDDELRTIPVIILSGSDREADVAHAYEHYANSFVTKPPDLKQLIAALQEIESYWFTLVRRV